MGAEREQHIELGQDCVGPFRYNLLRLCMHVATEWPNEIGSLAPYANQHSPPPHRMESNGKMNRGWKRKENATSTGRGIC